MKPLWMNRARQVIVQITTLGHVIEKAMELPVGGVVLEGLEPVIGGGGLYRCETDTEQGSDEYAG